MRAGVAARRRLCCAMGANKRCSHGKRKNNCADCTGCSHGKVKYDCADCRGCPHGKVKRKCSECR